MDEWIEFNGRSTKEFSMHVEKFPVIRGPARRRNKFQVPGRSGDLIVDGGTLENYVQPYECYFHDRDSASPEMAHRILEWLMQDGEYHHLSDAYDPTHYHRAAFAGPFEAENFWNQYGRCVLEFDCDPRAFLTCGDSPVNLTAPQQLYNTTRFAAKPTFTIHGTGPGTLTVAGVPCEIKALTDYITLDCERMTAMHGTEYRDGDVYIPRYPTLPAGSSEISWDGGITSVEIVPRWWTV